MIEITASRATLQAMQRDLLAILGETGNVAAVTITDLMGDLDRISDQLWNAILA